MLTFAGRTSMSLEVQQPYRAASMLQFLGRRAVAGIEAVGGDSYARTLRLPSGPGSLRLEFRRDTISCDLVVSDPTDLPVAVQRCRRLLDLDTDIARVETHLCRDVHLAPWVRRHTGLRVPGHVDGFEVAVRAVVGQQISVPGARTILGRLVQTYGDAIPGSRVPFGAPLDRLFPTPEVMAEADPDRLPMPRSRGRALVGIASAVATGRMSLDGGIALPTTRRALLDLPGIGPWTADYIALRALGDRDVFLGTDLGVRHGLQRMGLGAAAAEVVQRWSPWRSYAVMHVWQSLEAGPA